MADHFIANYFPFPNFPEKWTAETKQFRRSIRLLACGWEFRSDKNEMNFLSARSIHLRTYIHVADPLMIHEIDLHNGKQPRNDMNYALNIITH